jgi:hypothetical protein
MAWQDPPGQPEWRDAYGQYGQHGGQQGQDPYSPYGPEPQDTPPPGYGAQDPYAQSAYGQDPYSQYSYAQDPYAQYDYSAYGPAPVPTRSGTPGATVAALIANIASAIFCCGIGVAWIPGIILAAIALSKNSTDPDTARKLTIGAWICLGVDLVLTVVGFMLLGIFSDSHSTTTY